MKTIYIDSEFKCHVSDNGTMKAVETDFFDGKCDTFIEGYRFVPQNETWTRDDEVIFYGEMIAPWKPDDELANAQHMYERQKLSEYKESLLELGVEV